jgi:hypothetical protein
VKRASSQTFEAFCREAIDFLKSSATPYLMIGGIAVGAIGEPRVTGDVDVIGYMRMDKALALIDAAVAAGFTVARDEREKLQATGTLRFRKGQFELDIILASLPFEDDARARARKHRLFGRLVPLPTPEDLILFKVLAGRDKDPSGDTVGSPVCRPAGVLRMGSAGPTTRLRAMAGGRWGCSGGLGVAVDRP